MLDGAEQLHLPHEADFTQFVEEKRAPVGLIQIPFLVGRRTGERTLLVAEQLAFKEAFRDGPAVDRHKGLLIPGAAVVDGPGRQLLACPRFAVNDHVVVHGRRFGDEIEAVICGELPTMSPEHRALRRSRSSLFSCRIVLSCFCFSVTSLMKPSTRRGACSPAPPAWTPAPCSQTHFSSFHEVMIR